MLRNWYDISNVFAVAGILMGKRRGTTVEIVNSFKLFLCPDGNGGQRIMPDAFVANLQKCKWTIKIPVWKIPVYCVTFIKSEIVFFYEKIAWRVFTQNLNRKKWNLQKIRALTRNMNRKHWRRLNLYFLHNTHPWSSGGNALEVLLSFLFPSVFPKLNRSLAKWTWLAGTWPDRAFQTNGICICTSRCWI